VASGDQLIIKIIAKLINTNPANGGVFLCQFRFYVLACMG